MDSTLLTRLEKAGGSGILPARATLEERRLVAAHLVALKQTGHAIQADESPLAPGQENGDLRIIHYRTCTACKKGVV